MRARGFGRILAVSSYTARLGIPFASIYGASKAGLERWIETLAVELHPFGLLAHALEVGMFIARAAKPPATFAKVLADTIEAKNPPILRPVGVDAWALYLAQRLLPSRLAPALLRLAFR
jgi:NAD(P)-dependent dehydrogenase (short-subunit alcohol dehydrogenase family)